VPNRPEDLNNPVLKISNEHKLIVGQLKKLEEDFRYLGREEFFQEFCRTSLEFQDAIRRHFEFEERFLFEPMLQTIPSADVVRRVLQLQKQHGIVLERLRMMDRFLEADLADLPRSIEILVPEVRNLIAEFKEHAMVEIKDVFPHVFKNPRCFQMVMRQVQEWEHLEAKRKAQEGREDAPSPPDTHPD